MMHQDVAYAKIHAQKVCYESGYETYQIYRVVIAYNDGSFDEFFDLFGTPDDKFYWIFEPDVYLCAYLEEKGKETIILYL
jgi:hypothetical protein